MVTKKGQKFIQTSFSELWLLYCGWCHLLFFNHEHLVQAKAKKTKNTVSHYKKGSKIQSDRIFWSATSTLRIVSFLIFNSWPFYQVKSWKSKIPFLIKKSGQKLNPTRFSNSWPQIVCHFISTFVSKSFLRMDEQYGFHFFL